MRTKFIAFQRTLRARSASALVSFVLSWLALLPANSPAPAQTASDVPGGVVHIGVLGLFHPHELVVSASEGAALVLNAGDERIVLERSSGLDIASIRISGSGILLAAGARVVRLSALTITGRKNEPVAFVLSVPGKIKRRYRGTLEIKQSVGILVAIVAMDRETAIESVLAAESAPDTPPEALKAQAVAARSYFLAGRGRHVDFDFCDTTHCQFLREPPLAESPSAKAVAATSNLVLAYDSLPLAAMYTRSCGGRTHTPAELGLPSSGYPYFPVECQYCRAHPARWASRISAQSAGGLHSSDESARLEVDRRLGWAAVPSNDFVMKRENDQLILKGTGRGHGIGLCQSGAKAMADKGASFQQILSHYYPNTTIVHWPAGSTSRMRLRAN